jgi:hypothetical protein
VIIVKPQGVRVESLEILEFATRTNIRKDRGFKEFEGRGGLKSSRRNQFQKGDAELFGEEHKELEQMVKFSEGELPIFCGPLDLVDQ